MMAFHTDLFMRHSASIKSVKITGVLANFHSTHYTALSDDAICCFYFSLIIGLTMAWRLLSTNQEQLLRNGWGEIPQFGTIEKQ